MTRKKSIIEKLPKKKFNSKRLLLATGHSFNGFAVLWREPAFVQEIILILCLSFGLFLRGCSMLQGVYFLTSCFILLIVETLNTAIEFTVDRISRDIHPLSKAAKDVGSAAVFMALTHLVICWLIIMV